MAHVSGVLDTREDFARWAGLHRVKATVVDYDDIALAQEAVRTGACDLLLAAVSETPSGFMRVADVRRRLTYIAVRKDLPALRAAFARALRAIRLNEREWYARAWAEVFGPPPPGRLVRMGVYFEPGLFDRGPNGVLLGHVNEYAQRIADERGWQIDPIYCEYDEALAALAQGRLDLLGGVTYTPARQRQMLFSRVSAGLYQNFLYSRRLPLLSAVTAPAWDQAHVVTGPGEEARARLDELFARLGVHAAVSAFPTAEAAVSAYETGAADALFLVAYDGAKAGEVVATFPPVPWYFVVAPGREDLRAAFDDAIMRIQAQFPNLQTVTQHGHAFLPAGDALVLTEEERACLAARAASGRPVCVEMSPPVLMWKEWDGSRLRTDGVLSMFLDAFARRTGLRFQVLPPASQAVARARFLDGTADVWASYMADLASLPAERRRVVVFSTPVACVVRHGLADVRPGETRFAVVESDSTRREVLEQRGFADGMLLCRTEEACFRAVVDGRADATLSTPRTGLVLMRRMDAFDDLEIRSVPALAHMADVGFEISPKADPVLAAALEKAMRSVTPIDCEQFVRETLCRRIDGTRLSTLQVVVSVFSGVVLALLLLVAVAWQRSIRLRRSAVAAHAADEAKSQFLSTISHEIRTPLNVLVGFADFLNRPNLTKEQVREYTDGIRLSSQVLLSLINDVLDLSQIEAGKMDMSGQCSLPDLFEVLQVMFAGLAKKKGLALEIDLQPGLPVIGISAQRIRQILFNLISNAVKYTEKGGVRVSCVGVRDPSGERLDLAFRVADTGIGIAPERAEAVFNPFEQDLSRRGGKVFEGTGLGLAIVKRLVEVAGGTVSLESRVGVGSVFTVRFPAVKVVAGDAAGGRREAKGGRAPMPDGRPSAAAAPEAEPAPVGAGVAVLVVDDVPLNLRIFSIYLGKLGATDVRLAANGRQALEMVRARKPDIVFTDMWMPEMNGAELAAALRQLPDGHGMMVVAVTADADSAATFRLDDFDVVMTKPATAEKIVRVFNEFHGGGGGVNSQTRLEIPCFADK